MSDAVDTLDQAFARDLPAAPERSHLATGTGDLLLMPAWGDQAAGVKLVTVAPDNPDHGLPLVQGVYVLFEKPSLRPILILDAAALTGLRTAAVSGVATKYLANKNASSLVIFGAGVQAQAHLEAMSAVCPIEKLRVVSRTPTNAGTFVDGARKMGFDADVAGPDAVADADLVCACTTSSNPVFDGDALAPGAHVNAVGSYTPDARELDDSAIRRARIVVDTRSALRESGDLLAPIEAGVLKPEDVADLAEVVSGSTDRADDEITIFKSVGAAFEDLVVAAAAAARLNDGARL